MSELATNVRPYQQEPTTRASIERRDAMTNSIRLRLTGLTAAACTTLLLFSAVASLADDDRKAVELAKDGRPAILASAPAAAR
jgi:hypothetical protein